jgi:flagellar motor switch protein FliM
LAEKASKVSKEEMDALSVACEPGDADPKEIRAYDFLSPNKFSKDHLRTLNAIHTDFAAELTTVLTGSSQLPTRVTLTGVDQVSYKEYRTSIPSKTLFAELSAEPLSPYMLLELNPGIVGTWVDYLCGGNQQIPAEPSDLTPIDLAVAQYVLKSSLQAYTDCWSSMITLKPEIRHTASSESYDETLVPSEAVLVCSFEITVAETTGAMTICLPAVGVESVLPMLSTYGLARSSNKRQASTSELMKRLIETVNIPCRVELGCSRIALSEATNLKVGDVIKTTRSADAEMDMYVGNVQLFACRPGVRGKDIAVVISDTVAATPVEEKEAPPAPIAEPEVQEPEVELAAA